MFPNDDAYTGLTRPIGLCLGLPLVFVPAPSLRLGRVWDWRTFWKDYRGTLHTRSIGLYVGLPLVCSPGFLKGFPSGPLEPRPPGTSWDLAYKIFGGFRGFLPGVSQMLIGLCLGLPLVFGPAPSKSSEMVRNEPRLGNGPVNQKSSEWSAKSPKRVSGPGEAGAGEA